jgi:hypothetical protein
VNNYLIHTILGLLPIKHTIQFLLKRMEIFLADGLIRHFSVLPNEALLTRYLRSALLLPKDTWDAQRRMCSFVQFLEKMITSQHIPRGQLQSARVPFFLSARWHLQDSERWPIFYTLVHTVLMAETEILSTSYMDAYFVFRKRFVSLAKALGLSIWELEHLSTWYEQHHIQKKIRRLEILPVQSYHKRRPDMPKQSLVSRIDVLWLDREQVVAAYEIEHTTDISTGLLRLYDLGALCPPTSHLCVVAPRERLRKIQFELSRPAFNRQDVRDRCGIITEELLLEQETHILRWAGSLSVIEELLHVGCPTSQELCCAVYWDYAWKRICLAGVKWCSGNVLASSPFKPMREESGWYGVCMLERSRSGLVS